MMPHANLLPGSLRRQLLIRRRVRQWLVVYGVLSVLLLIVAEITFNRFDTARKRLGQDRLRSASILRIASEIRRFEQQNKALAARQALLKELEPPWRAIDVLALVSDSIRKTDGKTRLTSCVFESTPAATRDTNLAAPACRMSLEGESHDDLAVARLMAVLRDGKVFRSVECRSSPNSSAGSTQPGRWSAECIK